MPGALTAKDIQVLLIEAADTLRRLRVSSPEPKAPRAFWPTPIQDYWNAYGYTAARARLGPPAADAIDRMDIFMLWLSALMKEARDIREGRLWVQVLMAWASGHSFQRISDQATHLGHRSASKTSVQRIFADCIRRLTALANRELAA